MKKAFQFLLASLFLAGVGTAMADDMDHHDDHHDGHEPVKVIVVHKRIHHRHHPKPHAAVILKVGGDEHH